MIEPFLQAAPQMEQSGALRHVVQLRSTAVPLQDGSLWAHVQVRLHDEDAATYGAWYHALTDGGLDANVQTLAAPTRFHATYVATNLKEKLLAAVRRVDPGVRDIRIIG